MGFCVCSLFSYFLSSFSIILKRGRERACCFTLTVFLMSSVSVLWAFLTMQCCDCFLPFPDEYKHCAITADWQTILMKYHTFFFSKIGEDVAKFVVCCSRDWRLRVKTVA